MAQSAGHHPEQLVAGAETGSLPGRPGQYTGLLTEQEVLGDQRLTVADGRTDKAEQKQQVLEYRWNIMPLSAWICPADFCTREGYGWRCQRSLAKGRPPD
jgi:hypothetical protein